MASSKEYLQFILDQLSDLEDRFSMTVSTIKATLHADIREAFSEKTAETVCI